MGMSKRRFIQSVSAVTALAAAGAKAADGRKHYDLLIVGAGTAGIPAAIFAAARGASVLVVEVAPVIGGTLLLSSAQICAAGTRVQRQMGIVDSPEEHLQDLMRISRGTIDPTIARLVTDNAADTIDWLMEKGYELLPGYPVHGIAHEPYSKPRYYWSAGRGIAILEVMRPMFMEAVSAGKVDLLLERRAVEIQTEASGAVSAVLVADSGGKHNAWRARNVLLASGGYASNPRMYQQFSGLPKFLDGSYQFAQGDGIGLAKSVGGYVRNADKFLTNFGVVLATTKIPSTRLANTVFHPQLRQPWEIYVNADGRRFVREDVPSVDAREQALRFQPGRRHWVLFDQAVLDRAPPILEGWSREELEYAFRMADPSFYSGDTIEELARATGLPPATLAATVEGYNYGVHTGNDFFGRRHMPIKLQKAPFYAIRHQGTSITSTAGIAVNDRLQVVRRDGSAVPNLYAAGEILGAGATQGQAFCGGMMVTPALTFGRLLGERLIRLA
ncbi:MAG TPA: FAD-binding protein [Steroidobacteraceae bacterium]|nr:FAD-binding protein [Steroidobacteraceae bacterium]HQZ78980.1 FAD-binding protein [Steroidobacteraceae bacterium]